MLTESKRTSCGCMCAEYLACEGSAFWLVGGRKTEDTSKSPRRHHERKNPLKQKPKKIKGEHGVK